MPMLPFADPQPPAAAGPDETRPSAGEEAGDVFLALLPWGVSVLVHVCLVVLALFAIWIAVVEQSREQVVPTIHASDQPNPQMQMQEQELTRQPTETREPVEAPEAPAEPVEALAPVEELDLISHEAMAVEADPFAAPVAQGADSSVEMFGSSGNAKLIVFIVDATGSLVADIPFVVRELKATISELTEDQRFTVMFFNGDGVVELPPPGLTAATAQAKQRAIDWLDGGALEVHGKASPVAAISRALRYRPELVFLLSDDITGIGQYAIDPDDLLQEIRRTNTAKTKINTMQFLYPDPLEAQGQKGTMQRIAEQTGGVYTFIGEDELKVQ